ncbi:MAG: dTDP-4-dehydrorhamnose 3,5-epimerase [Bacteroidota bacterium]|nr:dTDP-4-dehydrorhamnose 3,5-epimerase [Bacteroidota bacterium]
MNIRKTNIEGLVVIEPKIFRDERGYFFESYSARDFSKEVGDICFVQDNESKSSYGVLRGLHLQTGEYAQSKLVRVVKGEVLDVAVDLRKDSKTFGQHYSIILNEDNHLQFFIPKGFAHGFAVLSKEVIFQYKCDAFYSKEHEDAIIWNDKILDIDWHLPLQDVILSEKDKNHQTFLEYKNKINL